jgi:hypothetical protein
MSSTETTFKQYMDASIYGAMRGLAGLPIEHPFDACKTFWQANPGYESSLKVVQAVYQRGGIKGFYSGAIPNSIRLAGKQIYRWPMMLAFPPFFKSILPEKTAEHFPSAPKICTGFAIANFEVFLITPLERFKVWYITQNPNEKKIRFLFSAEKSTGAAAICFKGLNAVWARQVISWVSFLAADAKFKEIERKKYPDYKELPFYSLMKVSVLVGGINTLCNMPFDVVKTQLQQANPIQNAGIFATMERLVKQYGVRALYRGWPIRMAQYIIQSAFTVTLLEKLERNWQK